MERKSGMSDFEILESLGKGVYSTVHKVRRMSDYCIYAMKKVQLGRLNAKEKENALNEVRILASINHPNIIEYKEAFIEESTS
jgi:NIMA (never in mitosis gene a)-related kinase